MGTHNSEDGSEALEEDLGQGSYRKERILSLTGTLEGCAWIKTRAWQLDDVLGLSNWRRLPDFLEDILTQFCHQDHLWTKWPPLSKLHSCCKSYRKLKRYPTTRLVSIKLSRFELSDCTVIVFNSRLTTAAVTTLPGFCMSCYSCIPMLKRVLVCFSFFIYGIVILFCSFELDKLVTEEFLSKPQIKSVNLERFNYLNTSQTMHEDGTTPTTGKRKGK